MKTNWIVGLMLVFATNISAQDLIIKYDFIKDKFTYTLDGQPVIQPTVKKNYEVKVYVENLNPFVFMARCTFKQRVADENSSMSGIASMFKGVGGIGSISTLLTGLNMGQFEDLGIRGGASLLESNLAAKSALQNVINSNNRLLDVEQTMLKIEYSADRLQKLKFNPYLPADTLKQLAYELTAGSLSNKPVKNQNLSATKFIQFSSDLNNTMTVEYDNLVKFSAEFKNEYVNYAAANKNNFAELGLDQHIDSLLARINVLRKKYSADIINNKIDALEQQYETITYTPFNYSCNYMATGDQLSFTLDFFQSNPAGISNGNNVYMGDAADTLRKVRTKSINILIRGDVKINTSVGLGFPTYFNKNQTYNNRDSVIIGTAGNNFAPCISTYINFYPYSGRNIHWGGTFGVGIPVQNEGVSTLNFFLGGSAILGSNSKVVLHGGLAIGQLNILSNGQKIGDKLPDALVSPTTKKSFQTGAFFGISFAISK